MGLFLTDPKCIKQREIVGIPAWQQAGFTGKGIVVLHDDIDENHSGCCADIIKTILPDATVLEGGISHWIKNDEVYKCTVDCKSTGDILLPFDEFIVKHNVSQINNSTNGGRNDSNSPLARYMRSKIQQYNLIGTGSFGNYTDLPTNKYQGAFIMVSGITLWKDGSYVDYGVAGKDCDFAMFMGFQDGTSFSAPFLNGMCGLYRSKYGRNVTQNEVYALLKKNCQDLGIVGRDAEWGWGLPKMVDVNKKYITLQIDSNVMTVDGVNVFMDTVPVIDKNNRTLVPIRKPMEALGHTVDWIASERKVVIYE